MEWNKESFAKILSKVFGLELTPDELFIFWEGTSSRAITPIGPKSTTIAMSPRLINTLFGEAVERTGLTPDHPRFKKVREEVIPASNFALYLKKRNDTEFFLVPGDVPDISLVPVDEEIKKNPQANAVRKLKAFPLEILNINASALVDALGSSATEKIADVIVKKKFIKRY